MCQNIGNNSISRIMADINAVIKKYEENEMIIKECDDETQDLLHEAELGKSKEMQGRSRFYSDIREIRQKRRISKDENSLLEEFYNYIQENKLKDSLQKIQSNAAKSYNALQLRFYKAKIRDDLTCCVCKAVVEKNRKIKQEQEKHKDLIKDFINTSKIRKKNKYL